MDSNGKDADRRPVTRRLVLKTTAASAGGIVAASGTAAAEGPKLMQVNFCGCSQVCVVREQKDGDESFDDNEDDTEASPGGTTVVTARETSDGWEFSGDVKDTGYYCDDSGESGDWKIIGVFVSSEGDDPPIPSYPGCFVCNPTQCAADALDAYLQIVQEEGGDISCVNGEPPEFGTFRDITCSNKQYDFKVVRGLCGEPGKDRNGRGNNENRGPPSNR